MAAQSRVIQEAYSLDDFCNDINHKLDSMNAVRRHNDTKTAGREQILTIARKRIQLQAMGAERIRNIMKAGRGDRFVQTKTKHQSENTINQKRSLTWPSPRKLPRYDKGMPEWEKMINTHMKNKQEMEMRAAELPQQEVQLQQSKVESRERGTQG